MSSSKEFHYLIVTSQVDRLRLAGYITVEADMETLKDIHEQCRQYTYVCVCVNITNIYTSIYILYVLYNIYASVYPYSI